MSKFTKEFIAEQRKIMDDYEAALCNYHNPGAENKRKCESDFARGRIIATQNYAEALDEIERRGAWIECLQRSVKDFQLELIKKHSEISILQSELDKAKKRKWRPASERPGKLPTWTGSVDVICRWADGTKSLGFWDGSKKEWWSYKRREYITPIEWKYRKGSYRGEPWPEGGEE